MSGSGAFRVVRVYDPAIDFDSISQATWDEYITTRDVDLIDGKWYPDQQPVMFWCRPLTLSERRDVLARPESERNERAFAYGVTRVDNLYVVGGGRRQWMRPESGAKPRPLSDQALEAFAADDVIHVGQVVISRSFSSPDRPLFVPLLDTCRDALTAVGLARFRRRAAQTSSTSPSPASNSSPEATQP